MTELAQASGGDAESFPEFKARHPELTPKQALDAWRAKRAEANTSTAAFTCNDNPNPMPPTTHAVADGIFMLSNRTLILIGIAIFCLDNFCQFIWWSRFV